MDIIEARVRNIVAQELGVAEVDLRTDSSFIDDLGAASLALIGLTSALEDEFGMDIPEEDYGNITTVQQAIDYAAAHCDI